MKNSVCALVLGMALTTSARAEVDAAPVLRAEYAFAAAAAGRGVRDAFLEYAAEDAVLFRPRAVDAREFLEASAASTGRLEWYPAYAMLAASRDLGFTTGPWVARREAGAPAGAHGHYVTVWRQQEGGAWRFVVDHGISHPPPQTPATALSAGTESGNDVPPVAFSDRDAASAELERANDGLDAALVEQGPPALLARYDENVRVYREGALPALGAAAARDLIGAGGPRDAASRAGLDVSEAGDLGYTYGYVDGGDANGHGEFVYLRVWRRTSGVWHIVLDLESPLP